jgi:hypothetical protein
MLILKHLKQPAQHIISNDINMKKFLINLRRKLISDVTAQVSDVENKVSQNHTGKESQLIIKNQYKSLPREAVASYSFSEVGFRRYSQNAEDGILLFIFSVIGVTNKTVLEICGGDGIECNAANLVINHGWNAFLFDGDAERQKFGKTWYARHPDTFTFPPRFINAWITKENIDQLITENEVSGEIDLLSLDLDGNDYWIWEGINCVRPRVVVAEIQCIWGNDKAVTIPYAPDFVAKFVDGFGVYSGASLPAFVQLAKKKGYRFVGLEKFGFNAFFIREDVAPDVFPAVDAAIIEQVPFVKWAKKNLLPKVAAMNWQAV